MVSLNQLNTVTLNVRGINSTAKKAQLISFQKKLKKENIAL